MPENIFLQSGDMDKVEKLSRQKVVSLSVQILQLHFIHNFAPFSVEGILTCNKRKILNKLRKKREKNWWNNGNEMGNYNLQEKCMDDIRNNSHIVSTAETKLDVFGSLYTCFFFIVFYILLQLFVGEEDFIFWLVLLNFHYFFFGVGPVGTEWGYGK